MNSPERVEGITSSNASDGAVGLGEVLLFKLGFVSLAQFAPKTCMRSLYSCCEYLCYWINANSNQKKRKNSKEERLRWFTSIRSLLYSSSTVTIDLDSKNSLTGCTHPLALFMLISHTYCCPPTPLSPSFSFLSSPSF
jgi:hypothetical protein